MRSFMNFLRGLIREIAAMELSRGSETIDQRLVQAPEKTINVTIGNIASVLHFKLGEIGFIAEPTLSTTDD